MHCQSLKSGRSVPGWRRAATFVLVVALLAGCRPRPPETPPAPVPPPPEIGAPDAGFNRG